MGSHIIDSVLNGSKFGSVEIAPLFTDANRVQKWFDVEAALAQTQAELGLIPAAAAAEIVRKARVELVSLEQIAAEIGRVSHNLVPALHALQHVCEGDAGEFIHYGTTTQDIVDTGMVLQVREAWAILLRDLREIRATLADQARRHRGTVMAGRTHGQQALPTTWGFKLAVWVDEVDRHLERCAEAEKRIFVGNITGAVGTMASFGGKGAAVQEGTLKRLGLGVPRICWHSARDRFTELACLLVQITGTLGKIANVLCSLQQTEVHEVREAFQMGRVGSSTMPHKQNPSTLELVVALARLVRGNLVPLTDTLFVDHERDARAWRIEWAALPEALVYSGAVLAHMRRVLAGMEAHAANMQRNLGALGGLLLSERVMLALGEHVGKQTAHDLVYAVAMKSAEEGVPFVDALQADPRVAPHLSREAIEALLDPAAYIGEAREIVDAVVGAPAGT